MKSRMVLLWYFCGTFVVPSYKLNYSPFSSIFVVLCRDYHSLSGIFWDFDSNSNKWEIWAGKAIIIKSKCIIVDYDMYKVRTYVRSLVIKWFLHTVYERCSLLLTFVGYCIWRDPSQTERAMLVPCETYLRPSETFGPPLEWRCVGGYSRSCQLVWIEQCEDICSERASRNAKV